LTRKRRGLVDPVEVKFTVRKVFEGLRRVLMFFTQNLLLNSERLFEERLGFRVLAHRRFVVPVRTIHAGPNPKYFGPERGVTYYNLVSDQFTGLNAITVPGTLRDSLVLLSIVLEQETELEPTEIMTIPAHTPT
jgi:hypothetical protein